MKIILLFILLIPGLAKANFLLQYGLNYSSETDNTSSDDYETKRTFHKILLGASVNSRKTVFFGWNINSWSSSLTKVSDDENYSMTEMGPRLTYFFSDSYNGFLTAEWNPYAKGKRDKTGSSSDVTGSSMAFGIGYRFKISQIFGLGAGLYYQSLSLSTEIQNSTESSVSDKITHIMPMLEFTIITR
jgi:hypothetical protein